MAGLRLQSSACTLGFDKANGVLCIVYFKNLGKNIMSYNTHDSEVDEHV